MKSDAEIQCTFSAFQAEPEVVCSMKELLSFVSEQNRHCECIWVGRAGNFSWERDTYTSPDAAASALFELSLTKYIRAVTIELRAFNGYAIWLAIDDIPRDVNGSNIGPDLIDCLASLLVYRTRPTRNYEVA